MSEWKPEYQLNRLRKIQEDPEYARRVAQQLRNRQERNREKRQLYMREYVKKNPEKFYPRTREAQTARNEYRRAKYATDPEFRAAKIAEVKRWAAKYPEKRKRQRLREFGLTLEEFDAMLLAQGNRCAICRMTSGNPNIFPLVDHCHASNKVRGLLCLNCNQALGKFKDNMEFLGAAIRYLKRNGG